MFVIGTYNSNKIIKKKHIHVAMHVNNVVASDTVHWIPNEIRSPRTARQSWVRS